MSTQKVVELPRKTVSSVSPLTGELLREFEQHSDDVVENKLALAAKTFREYRKVPFAQRAAMMLRAAEIMEKEKDAFGRMMTQEMGKTLKSAVQEAEKSAFGCRYYAENAERFMAEEEAKTNAARSFVRYQPIGPVLAVMPELSFLAGVSLCGTCAHGGQRWIAEARFQRATVRAGH